MTDTQADLTERAEAYRLFTKDWNECGSCSEAFWRALQSEREAAIDHLRNALYLFADIHPDYTSKSFRNAVEFYNVARPDRKVEPSGFEPKHFVTESAIQGRCEDAAAEARRALETISHLARKPDGGRTADEMSSDLRSIADICRRALASPAPQEDAN